MRGLRYYTIEIVLIAVLGGAVAYFGYLGYGLLAPAYAMDPFSGERAHFYVAQQLEFGERSTGSDGGKRAGDWLTDELSNLGWDVIVQSYAAGESVVARNIIAQKGQGPETEPAVILSTHYDTRSVSDLDPDESERTEPTPGANAGGSGTAVLLELARTLEVEATGHTVCLVFFDGEDNGGLPGWEPAMGSAAFLERTEADTPRCSPTTAAVYLDLVGGQDARIAAIAPTVPSLPETLRAVAERVGYAGAFRGPHMRDETDALARFTEAGVPAVMIADMGYKHRHTGQDTLDKISTDTLQQVGDVLKAWLEAGAQF
jgi:glutaminyl-peptide cyclotransferase